MNRAVQIAVSTLVVATAMMLIPTPVSAMHAAGGPEIRMLGEDIPVGVSLRGSLGTMSGQATRSAYLGQTSASRLLSESTWDLRGINFIGCEATAEIMDLIRVNMGLWNALNEGSGSMEEYRWLWIDSDWSHWQQGEVDVIDATMFDVNVAVDVVNFEGILLSVVGGWKRDSWAWVDRAEFYRGTDKAFRDESEALGGINTIGYQQVYSVLYAGVNARYSMDAVDFELYLNLSPLSKASDSIHYKNRELEAFQFGIHGEGETGLGSYVAGGGRASYNVTDNLFAALALDSQAFPRRDGESKITEKNEVQGIVLSQSAAMFSGLIGWRF